MRTIPILFSTPMVQALLDGRKTQTRRVVKPQPDLRGVRSANVPFEDWHGREFKCPYGQPGDVLWVRETYYAYGWWVKNGKTKTGKQKWKFIDFTVEDKDGKYHYEDSKPSTIENSRTEQKIGWYKRTSLFMPMEACRLFLKVKSVRVERLHDISEEDAIAEGIEQLFKETSEWVYYRNYNESKHLATFNPHESFFSLWQSINGRKSLDANPWVWVVAFERTEKPANWPN